ncbi:MAG: SDR family NAD(P)-dependent oxidoreductase [Candidatus Dormibacteraeota bacterium]|nr:SDR family NAD(P)-dependent oxidoreductase [Candidatus Dormibacteraeota bacterium]
MRDPHGARLLLTGATSGLGPVLARALHTAGYRLVLSGRRAEALAPLGRELVGSETVVADLAQPADVQRLAGEAGEVDVLVANAGVGSRGSLLEMDVGAIDETLEVNLRAPLVLTRLLVEGMVERRRGQIVLMASMAGQAPGPGQIVYGPTKAALRAFGFALRNELRGTGVGVSLVSPYFVSEAGMFARRGVHAQGEVTPRQVTDAVLRAIHRNPAEITVAPLALRLGRRIPGAFPEVMSVVPMRHPGQAN